MEPPTLSGRSYTHLWVKDYLSPGGALEGLQRVQRSGKARFIGFITRGNDYPAVCQLIETGAFALINASVNLLNPSAAMMPYGMRVDHDWGELLGYAATHGVGVSIYSPLAGGFLNANAASGGSPHPVAGGRSKWRRWRRVRGRAPCPNRTWRGWRWSGAPTSARQPDRYPRMPVDSRLTILKRLL